PCHPICSLRTNRRSICIRASTRTRKPLLRPSGQSRGAGAAGARRETGRMKRHWLFKTEPEAFSWERLQRERKTEWSGVRSFQARNNMMEMHLGDLGFFYHSSTKVPGIVGIVRVVREAYPDFTAR